MCRELSADGECVGESPVTGGVPAPGRDHYDRQPIFTRDDSGRRSDDTTEIEERLQQVGRYSQFVRAGLGVILGAFVPASAASVVTVSRRSMRSDSGSVMGARASRTG
ncbi:hypothetical protein BRC95_08115 [Halobacteriales archaeon QS_5_68_33]|nr:MAG: hypothetical protein BRC95_08115 [Halobacteriales archaeon QS_5_68_33]